MHRVNSVVRMTNLQPRPYQSRIVNKVVQIFRGEYVNERTGEHEEAVPSIMIESPTGSGKTCMALLAAKTLQADDPDLTFGWVAMRRNLLHQARHENTSKNINVKNIHWVSMFDKRPSALIEAKRAGKRVCLIVDEAQHDTASSMAHLHNIIEPDLILGMTATPFRTDRMKLCFHKVLKDCGIHQLIRDGFLSPYHHYTIPQWAPAEVAHHYCADPKRWGKSLFFFVSLAECHELGRLFAARGVKHQIVTGSSNREEQIVMFTNGEIDCLINCMVLAEGFDCPSLQTTWVRDSSKGPTIQMGGRSFRKFADLPFKQIVQSKQTKWPFMRTAMPDQQHLWVSGEWRSLKVNPHLAEINRNSRLAIASVEVTLPEFLTKKHVRKFRIVWD